MRASSRGSRVDAVDGDTMAKVERGIDGTAGCHEQQRRPQDPHSPRRMVIHKAGGQGQIKKRVNVAKGTRDLTR